MEKQYTELLKLADSQGAKEQREKLEKMSIKTIRNFDKKEKKR